jgi:putative tricarboxylic transport membrane protein
MATRGFDKDVLAGLALAALGSFIALRATSWDLMGEDGPGPGFFPLGYGVLMVALSLLLTLRALFRPSPDSGASGDLSGHVRALATWAVFAGSAVAMQYTGFVLGFAVLAMFIVTYVFRRGWRSAVLVGVGCSAGFWLVFTQALGVALPAGPWGF